MNKGVKRFIFVSLLGVLVLLSCGTSVLAQTNSFQSDVAQNVEVADNQSSAGDILTVTGDGLKRSTVAYDDKIYGVIVDAPIISVEVKTDATKAVVTAGSARVRVSTAGGNIAVGDFITSSANAGIGQKATESGYVLGKALDKYEGEGEDLISVLVERGYAQIGPAKSTGQGGFFGSFVSDTSRLRTSLSALIALLVLAGGIIAFIRVVNSGVVAIGRNPLARATIIRGMIISGTVVVLIMAAGLGIAVAIIILVK